MTFAKWTLLQKYKDGEKYKKYEIYKDTTGDDIYKQDTTQVLDEYYNFNLSMIMV